MDQSLGFGIYLAARSASSLAVDPAGCLEMKRSLEDAGLEAWTANAFPYGGFHGSRVKEKAFFPDWSDPRRVVHTLDVARILARLSPDEPRLSLSTCPLGYGRNPDRDAEAGRNLRKVQEELLQLEREGSPRMILGLEAEPDGGLETVAQAVSWIEENIPDPGDGLRIGICWDLCHGAVVGEDHSQALKALEKSNVPLAKVQISSALRLAGVLEGEALETLRNLARDPWFHQVRGGLEGEEEGSWPDLEPFLEDVGEGGRVQARIHCHVPLTGPVLGEGLTRTSWEDGLRAAAGAGCMDFEVETYTLPFLPDSWKEPGGVVDTLEGEIRAAARCLNLDSPSSGN